MSFETCTCQNVPESGELGETYVCSDCGREWTCIDLSSLPMSLTTDHDLTGKVGWRCGMATKIVFPDFSYEFSSPDPNRGL